jgi:hypothetical protein
MFGGRSEGASRRPAVVATRTRCADALPCRCPACTSSWPWHGFHGCIGGEHSQFAEAAHDPTMDPEPALPDAARVTRVIGRLDELQRHRRREGEQQLGEALLRWSLAANHDWLLDGVRREEPFLQISTAAPGSVLAWELEQLHREGYCRIGPLWLPVRWLRSADDYRRVVRLIAAHVLSLPHDGPSLYVPKARAELEPMLAAWPHLLLLPCTTPLSIVDLIVARAWPVRALGVVGAPAWGDGRRCSPAEFFCHDVDHARFQVREDLLARGIVVPDPYVDGDTFDRASGEHRTLVPMALPHLDGAGWCSAAARSRRVHGWLDAIAGARPDELAEAALWLLFELVHEKSLPIEASVLTAALADNRHVDKLRSKCANGFFAAHGPTPAAVTALSAARDWLRTTIAAGSS